MITLAGCNKDSDESKIRRMITEMAQAVEAKNGREFISYLHDKFQDQGGRNKGQIRGMLAVIFLQNKKINISFDIDKILVQDESAQANIIVKGSEGQLFRLRTSQLVIQSLWKKHEDDWLLYRVNWKRLDREDAG